MSRFIPYYAEYLYADCSYAMCRGALILNHCVNSYVLRHDVKYIPCVGNNEPSGPVVIRVSNLTPTLLQP